MQRDLEYIYTVYKTGSFSKAGELLYASQPTVSMAVQRIEENIGYQIFERGSHPLGLTEAGKYLIEHIERVRKSEETLRNCLDLLASREHSPLRIGCTPMHASSIFPHVISRFREKAPETEISVESAFPKQLFQKLKNNELDIVLSTMMDSENADLYFIHAFNVQYLIAVPSHFSINSQLEDCALTAEDIRNNKHLDKHLHRVPISFFCGVPFITLNGETDFCTQSQKIFSESSFTPNSQLSVSTPASAYEMCQYGIGATLVGSFSIDKDENVIFYRLMSRQDERAFFFVTQKDVPMTEDQKLFIDEFHRLFHV